MSQSRCYGCCQENCAYSNCTCECHNQYFGDSRNQWEGKPHYVALDEAVARAEKTALSAVQAIAAARCPKHPRYQVKRVPRSACEACWRLWIASNPK